MSSSQQLKKPVRMTRQHKADALKKGLITGYFGRVQVGRPKKLQATNDDPQPIATAEVSRKKGTFTRSQWNSEELFPFLKVSVLSKLKGQEHSDDFLVGGIVQTPIHDRTIKRMCMKFKDIASTEGIELEKITREMVYHQTKNKGLLQPKDIEVLQDIIVCRDDANNGITRDEAISLVSQLSKCYDRSKCEQHWDYLLRKKKLSKLKAGGKVKKAQKTTIKRTQIHVEQQLRFHTTIDSTWEELKRLNQPSEEFEAIKEYFMGNLDEACLMASGGKVFVVASKAKNKTEKIADDCRDSITSLRVGFSSREQGAYFFLAKGVKLDRKKFKNLPKYFKAPPGSEIIMTPNAFMTDEAWLTIVPKLCKAIRQMNVICEHPDWWVYLSLDGYGSHVNVTKALEIFAEHQILIVKEEGDTSHVNQAYDQFVAKEDKRHMHMQLNTVRRPLGHAMDQWILISIAINAQNLVEKETWIASFKRVNMHPKYRVPFDEWIKILDTRGFLSAERYFTKRTSLYDAMPACWKRLSVEHRHGVLSTIRNIYATTSENEKVWTKVNVVRLAKYVKMDDVFKLRACYFAAKRDASVIIRESEETTTEDTSDVSNQANITDLFSWRPDKMLAEYKANRTDPSVQQKFFHHITDKVAEANWNIEHADVSPSDYLGIAMRDDQLSLLNPTTKHVLMGHILYDVKGKGAQQKLAKRRLDFIDGNTNSYAKCLNDPKRLKETRELNELVASVAEVTAEAIKEKAKKKERKDKEAADKIAKKAREAAAKEERRLERVPILTAYVDKYTNKAREVNYNTLLKEIKKDKAIKAAVLRDILNDYFKMTKAEVLGAKLPQLLTLFADKVNIKAAEETPNGQVSM